MLAHVCTHYTHVCIKRHDESLRHAIYFYSVGANVRPGGNLGSISNLDVAPATSIHKSCPQLIFETVSSISQKTTQSLSSLNARFRFLQ